MDRVAAKLVMLTAAVLTVAMGIPTSVAGRPSVDRLPLAPAGPDAPAENPREEDPAEREGTHWLTPAARAHKASEARRVTAPGSHSPPSAPGRTHAVRAEQVEDAAAVDLIRLGRFTL